MSVATATNSPECSREDMLQLLQDYDCWVFDLDGACTGVQLRYAKQAPLCALVYVHNVHINSLVLKLKTCVCVSATVVNACICNHKLA
jgi:hypothetical protein